MLPEVEKLGNIESKSGAGWPPACCTGLGCWLLRDMDSSPASFSSPASSSSSAASPLDVAVALAVEEALSRATHGQWRGGPFVTKTPNKRRPANDYIAKGCARAFRAVLFPPSSSYDSPRELAKVVAEELRKSCGLFAFVSVSENGNVLLTTEEQRLTQRERGLSICEGCGFFFATHAAGLANHWRTVSDLWCTAAAARARSAQAIADEESLAPPEAIDSAKWRGAGLARPSTWRSFSNKSSLTHPGLIAARDGDLEAVKSQVSQGTLDAKLTVDAHGSGALLWAAGGGHLHVVRWL